MDDPSTRFILVLDIGSSSVRCSVYRVSSSTAGGVGKAVVVSRRPLNAVHPTSGKIRVVEVVNAVEECIDNVLQRLVDEFENRFSILAVGFSTFVMNLVGVDADGNAVGDDATASYACNTDEVAKEVAAVKRHLGVEEANRLYAVTGAPIHSAYALAQLRVFYRTTMCDNVVQWQTIATYCISKWTGRNNLPISYSEASWTGLLNYQSCEYEPIALGLLPKDCVVALPKLQDYDNVKILEEGIPQSSPYLEKWPSLKDARFFLGLGDGVCANVGSKCTIPERIACTVGTSAAARVVLRLPVGSDSILTFEPGLFCYRIDKNHVLVGGALTDGGSVIEWARQLLNMEAEDAFKQCLVDVAKLYEEDYSSGAASSRLSFAPFLSGERSTGFRTGATGAMIGMTRGTTPAHFLKACLEGVTLRIDAVCRLIRKAIGTTKPVMVIASGKALEGNPLWRQMLADCAGLDMVFDDETEEGTSRGVACFLCTRLGISARQQPNDGIGVEVMNKTKVSNPRSCAHENWRRMIQAQDELINGVSPLFEA